MGQEDEDIVYVNLKRSQELVEAECLGKKTVPRNFRTRLRKTIGKDQMR